MADIAVVDLDLVDFFAPLTGLSILTDWFVQFKMYLPNFRRGDKLSRLWRGGDSDESLSLRRWCLGGDGEPRLEDEDDSGEPSSSSLSESEVDTYSLDL